MVFHLVMRQYVGFSFEEAWTMPCEPLPLLEDFLRSMNPLSLAFFMKESFCDLNICSFLSTFSKFFVSSLFSAPGIPASVAWSSSSSFMELKTLTLSSTDGLNTSRPLLCYGVSSYLPALVLYICKSTRKPLSWGVGSLAPVPLPHWPVDGELSASAFWSLWGAV